MFELMLPALVACLVLLGIHVYLGLHVLTRGVIFVDLALAQVAALGTTVALLWGAEPGTFTLYMISLGFTFGGAVLFTAARSLSDRVPVEAMIGIVYAVASAGAVILSDRLPHGADEIKEILVGSLLSVTWPDIWRTLAIYAVIGVFHFVFRERFLLVSTDPDEAKKRGFSIALWDMLFYLSFGVVITSAVAIGGVLIVFSFLVIPTVIVALFFRGLAVRLVAGWIVGMLGTGLGLLASVQFDMPTGAAVVVAFGFLLVVASLVAQVYKPAWLKDAPKVAAH